MIPIAGATGRLGGLLLALACAASAVPAVAASNIHPGRPGRLVIEAGFDSTRFRWAPLGEDGRRALVWDGGSLSLEPGVEPERFGREDLVLDYGADLAGVGQGRRFLFAPGRYRVDTPLLLADAGFHLTVLRGSLTVDPGGLRYVSDPPPAGRRGPYLLLAGLLLATITLMARARSRLRSS